MNLIRNSEQNKVIIDYFDQLLSTDVEIITLTYSNNLEKTELLLPFSVIKWRTKILIYDKVEHSEYQGKKNAITDEFDKNVLIYAVLAHTKAEYVTFEVINNQAEFCSL